MSSFQYSFGALSASDRMTVFNSSASATSTKTSMRSLPVAAMMSPNVLPSNGLYSGVNVSTNTSSSILPAPNGGGGEFCRSSRRSRTLASRSAGVPIRASRHACTLSQVLKSSRVKMVGASDVMPWPTTCRPRSRQLASHSRIPRCTLGSSGNTNTAFHTTGRPLASAQDSTSMWS